MRPKRQPPEEISFNSLIGEHLLTGVDFDNEKIKSYGDYYDDCQVMNFTLDEVTYTACEDPDDGYRSSMRYFHKSNKSTKNVFQPVKVLARIRTIGDCGDDDVLELIDVITGKLVLEVGTRDTDDYYPMFVAHFLPENMACNNI